MSNSSSSTTGALSRNKMYGMIAGRGEELIKKLWEETDDSNPSVRIAALRTLLDKVLPSLKATELSGKDGVELKELINVIIQSKPMAE